MVRYVAADLSPVMLARARGQAERRGLTQVEFVAADVESLPFGDAEFDLCVTYNSLHCFPTPRPLLQRWRAYCVRAAPCGGQRW